VHSVVLFQQKRTPFDSMFYSDLQVDDYAEADRREVNPSIEVESAPWSAEGTIHW
jgi:hypothetical protein